ncbi:hypothetical protein ABFU82_03330 [Nocardioides sp. WV_118_6]|uniref:hypothetical protein n=1 Tax=Pimelobacter sp. 30-1 TaxID=2004991 RepID=UPI001C0456FD|nr:hypothetical protein [Pimelobacter sp. 30-1]MBU2696823.1 hypothetical protein [Pimelobacter sp. 30-1]
MTDRPAAHPAPNPPPLIVAASVAGVQGAVLLLLAILEFASVTSGRLAFGLSTAGFFAAYGVVLIAAAVALWRRQGWSRGPVLITQLIFLGIAWNLREHVLLAIVLAVVALVVLAGMVSKDTMAVLDGTADADADDPDQPSASSD